MTAAVRRIRFRLIAADEPGGRAEAAAGGEEQVRHIAASAMAERQCRRGGPRSALLTDVVPDANEQRLVEAVEKSERVAAAFRRDPRRECAHSVIDVAKRVVSGVRSVALDRPR
jgi:predicted TIM-barrel fold metal-dependent hydrolase